jgi:Ice-binding-like/Bacterial Ig-like domain
MESNPERGPATGIYQTYRSRRETQMNRIEPRKLWFIALMTMIFLSASPIVSNAQYQDVDAAASIVAATSPGTDATAVTLNQPITATFSQDMSGPSTEAGLLVLGPDGSPISGVVDSADGTATFTPSGKLMADTTYQAVVTTEATDASGAPLANLYAWAFTTGAALDTTNPTVTSTDPIDLAMDVQTNQRIVAMFSEHMHPRSISRASFKVTKPGGATIRGGVSYKYGAASFKPTYGLTPNTHYIATITTRARDRSGNLLASDYVWSFDTGADPDLTQPTVTMTNPDSDATQVPISQAVNATFSKVMNYASIDNRHFHLNWAGGRVRGTIALFYDAVNQVTIASFVPKANLRVDTLYTATVTRAVRDLAGNRLAGNQPNGNNVWQFTTGSTAGLSTVPLGAAANFAILAAAAVTNTSTPTTITGDVGLWPGTSMTNFPPGTVNGSIHVNDTTAQAGEAAVAIAYNDAAGRTGAFTPAVGNIGGLTFAPGLYRSDTSTEISGGGDLTLDAQGDPNAVFIFQIGSTLTTSSGFGVTLTGGAKASQIFWQVGSSATIGVGSHFAGNILADTSITLVSGAVLDGRALAGAVSGSGAVSMDDNTVVRPAP